MIALNGNERNAGMFSQRLSVEIMGETGVLVVGGGSAGVVAALAAAEEGADTLLIEASGRLGGMMTSGNAGLTNSIFHHKKPAEQRKIVERLATEPESVQIVGGLPKRLMDEALSLGIAVGTSGTQGSYVFTSPVEFNWFLMDKLEAAGVRLIFHAFVVDAIVENGAVKGVVIESKEGRAAFLADTVIDTSGDGDVAARAGAEFVVGIGPDDAAYRAAPDTAGKMGAMGVMYRVGNVDLRQAFDFMEANEGHFFPQGLAKYSLRESRERLEKGEMSCFMVKGREFGLQVYNSPHEGVVTLCCPCCEGSGLSLEDLSRAELRMRDTIRKQLADIRTIPGFDRCIVLDVPEIGVRESRHLRGEYLLCIEDILSKREFADSIGRGSHTIDTDHVPREVKARDLGDDWSFQIPYRCLVPLKVDNLLVAGRCASFTHETFGAARTTVQCMIMGEAAGVAAAMCRKQQCPPRDLPPTTLTSRLRDRGVVL